MLSTVGADDIETEDYGRGIAAPELRLLTRADPQRELADLQQESDPGVRGILELSQDMIFIAREGRIVYMNGAGQRMLGTAGPGPILNRAPLDFFVPQCHPAVRRRIESEDACAEPLIEQRMLALDGTIVDVEVTSSSYLDRGERIVQVVCRDLRERKTLERQMLVLQATVEHRLSVRTGELRAALAHAELTAKRKADLLANTSHELRTPLHSILGFAGILLQGMAGPLNPTQSRHLNVIQGSARRLLQMIRDVLDESKIEAGQLKIDAEPFDLKALLESVAATLSPVATAKGLTFGVAVSAGLDEMVSDRRGVERIVINLLGNAIKFTDSGSVTLTAERVGDLQPSSAAAPQPMVRIRVKDTGIGIKAEDLSAIFQSFHQVHRDATLEGAGLGLAISRRLARALHGEITAVSEWAKGSQFSVFLPLRPPATDGAPHALEAAAAAPDDAAAMGDPPARSS